MAEFNGNTRGTAPGADPSQWGYYKAKAGSSEGGENDCRVYLVFWGAKQDDSWTPGHVSMIITDDDGKVTLYLSYAGEKTKAIDKGNFRSLQDDEENYKYAVAYEITTDITDVDKAVETADAILNGSKGIYMAMVQDCITAVDKVLKSGGYSGPQDMLSRVLPNQWVGDFSSRSPSARYDATGGRWAWPL